MERVGNAPLLYTGDEKEFFPGEIQDLILKTLSDALSTFPEKSRRADVIRDILKANEYKAMSKDAENQIKDLFNGYTNMNASLRQKLKALGIDVLEAGKHYKLTYHGDERYSSVISRSASDWREGQNQAHYLIQTCM